MYSSIHFGDSLLDEPRNQPKYYWDYIDFERIDLRRKKLGNLN